VTFGESVPPKKNNPPASLNKSIINYSINIYRLSQIIPFKHRKN
jgi:hypothetical protein